jgi:hypothetical protein
MRPFFSGVMVVNHRIKSGHRKKLHLKYVVYLLNLYQKILKVIKETLLKGTEGRESYVWPI